MSEKITIVIAVVTFFVISVISPLHIVMCGGVIIIALTCTRATREKRYLGEIKQLRVEKMNFILCICRLFTIAPIKLNFTITRSLIESLNIKEIDNTPALYLSCANVIIKMGTTSMVEEMLRMGDLTSQQTKNLEALKKAIKELSEKSDEE